jgi:hypothetical protein
MSGGLLILIDLFVAVALLAVAVLPRLGAGTIRSAAVAALPLVAGALLAVYVFGEDDYRGGGISRWDAYRSPGGALGTMFVASIVAMLGAAALLAYAARRGRLGLFRAIALATAAVAILLLIPTTVGFTAN